jgi:hypothetical protein
MEAHCQRCDKITPTVFLTLSTGHIGNLCAYCKTARKGKPYISKSELYQLQQAKTLQGKGPNHEQG